MSPMIPILDRKEAGSVFDPKLNWEAFWLQVKEKNMPDKNEDKARERHGKDFRAHTGSLNDRDLGLFLEGAAYGGLSAGYVRGAAAAEGIVVAAKAPPQD